MTNTIVLMQINQAWIISILLIATRLTAVLALTPMMAALPNQGLVKVMLVLSLSISLSLSITAPLPEQSTDFGWIVSTVITEAVTGFILGIGVLLAFSACSFAGKIVDIQLGYGIGQVFDPATRRQTSVITAMFSQLALFLFFTNDLHHLLLKGVAFSLERIPLGSSLLHEQSLRMIMQQVPAMFSLGFILVAPIIVFMMMVEFILGTMSRNMPQINMFVIGMPFKVMTGLVALSIWTMFSNEMFKKTYVQMFNYWEMVF